MNKISHWHEVWETFFPICTIERRIKLEFLSKEKFTFLFHWPLFAICYPPPMNTNLTYGFPMIFHRLRTNNYCMESIIWLTIRGFYKIFYTGNKNIFTLDKSRPARRLLHSFLLFNVNTFIFFINFSSYNIY